MAKTQTKAEKQQTENKAYKTRKLNTNKEKSAKTQQVATKKKPLVSTTKKIGLTMYFTFVGTLALVFGAQIWMADVYSSPSNTQQNKINNSTTTEQNYKVEQNSTQNTTYDNTNNNQSEWYVEDYYDANY